MVSLEHKHCWTPRQNKLLLIYFDIIINVTTKCINNLTFKILIVLNLMANQFFLFQGGTTYIQYSFKHFRV